LMMEAGLVDRLSFDVVEFDRPALSLLCAKCTAEKENWVVGAFILTTAILLLLSNLISPIRM